MRCDSKPRGESKENKWLHVYSDGAARGNPGPAGAGGQVRDQDGKLLVEISDFLGETTNNVAEYLALIRILGASADLGYRRLKIHTDSELLAQQLTGGFKVKSKALRPLLGKLKLILAGYRYVEVEHIPREKNYECDALANRAIDEGLSGLKKPVLHGESETLF